MVKKSSSENLASIPTIWTFQVKYWFRPLIFCRDGFEVRAGQKFVKERKSLAHVDITVSEVLPNGLSFLSTFDFQFQAIFF